MTAARKHWPDCALNHGGESCDMGPECGETDAERVERLAREDLAYLDDIEIAARKAGLASLLPVLRAVVAANAEDGSFPGSVCVAITRWREARR